MKIRTPRPRIPNDLHTRTDAELIVAAQEGQKWAFVEIVSRYQATVAGVALAILRDFAASEDAAQETFLTAWKKISSIREPYKLRPWLASIARRTALGHLRRRKPSEILDAGISDVNIQSPDEAAATGDERAMVLSMLGSLPESYRLPLVLYYFEGKSTGAVAKALEISDDAARKRLSRGREMLRETMASKLESVLGRSMPTTVFTMAIAGAIGALSQSSAIAATASAAATTTSTTTSAAMATSKITLAAVAALAVVCIPLGYKTREWLEPELVSINTTQVSGISDTASSDIQAGLPDSALVAEWIRLHEKHGTGAIASPKIHAEIMGIENQFQRRALFAALAAEWAELSPKTGIVFYATVNGRDWQLDAFVNEWVKQEGWDALDEIVRLPGWQDGARYALPRIMQAMLPHMADRDPSEMALMLEKLPKPNGFWDTAVRDAMALAASKNLDYMRAVAEKIVGPNRKQTLEGVALAWSQSNGAEAFEWAKTKFEGSESTDLVRFVLTGWAEKNPVAALDRMLEIPAQSEDEHGSNTTTAGMVLSAAFEADLDTALDWLKRNPEKVSSAMIADIRGGLWDRLSADSIGILSRLRATGTLRTLMPTIQNALLNEAAVATPEILEWIHSQESDSELKRLESAAWNGLAYREPVAAVEMLNNRLKENPSASVAYAVRKLIGSSEFLDRLDRLLPIATPELQQKLLRTSFTYLDHESLTDPEKWLDRLDDLQESHRGKAVIALARAWVSRDPIDATGWLEQLPDPGERASGYETVIGQWALDDAFGASQWTVDMPVGSDRDGSALGLVKAIAKSDPNDAWKWAASISDPTPRLQAATEVIGSLAVKDPALARAMIDQANFPTDEIETLSELLK